ncbi:MAG: hypothetical protein VX100_07325 [Pseudomonadota bacterium]|nr:hypothetical protein [Pseudomonadota bacterium]
MVVANVDNVELDVDKTYSKLFKIFNSKSNRALSIAMGLPPTTVQSAVNRHSFPWEGMIKACIKRGVSLDELFEIPIKDSKRTAQNEKATVVVEQKGFNTDDMLKANDIVDRVLDQVLRPRALPAERELLVIKKLRPILLRAVFDHCFNEVLVKSIAEGALALA